MMSESTNAVPSPEWATKSGDVWAERWRDTDLALEGLSSPLLSVITACAPPRPFNGFEIGCGPGSTTIAVASACPDAAITACDISPALAGIARERTANSPNVRVVMGDAELLAASEAPLDLIFSRHGVMFFPDPVRAFHNLRNASNSGASLVFSCFQNWESNPWASELASAAAGKTLPPPGRESGGFAFADPDYVRQILGSSGWSDAARQQVVFRYVAAEGEDAVQRALAFLSDLGPASRVVQSMPEQDRAAATDRMRSVIERHLHGAAVIFPAAAWIWRARAS